MRLFTIPVAIRLSSFGLFHAGFGKTKQPFPDCPRVAVAVELPARDPKRAAPPGAGQRRVIREGRDGPRRPPQRLARPAPCPRLPGQEGDPRRHAGLSGASPVYGAFLRGAPGQARAQVPRVPSLPTVMKRSISAVLNPMAMGWRMPGRTTTSYNSVTRVPSNLSQCGMAPLRRSMT